MMLSRTMSVEEVSSAPSYPIHYNNQEIRVYHIQVNRAIVAWFYHQINEDALFLTTLITNMLIQILQHIKTCLKRRSSSKVKHVKRVSLFMTTSCKHVEKKLQRILATK